MEAHQLNVKCSASLALQRRWRALTHHNGYKSIPLPSAHLSYSVILSLSILPRPLTSPSSLQPSLLSIEYHVLASWNYYVVLRTKLLLFLHCLDTLQLIYTTTPVVHRAFYTLQLCNTNYISVFILLTFIVSMVHLNKKTFSKFKF